MRELYHYKSADLLVVQKLLQLASVPYDQLALNPRKQRFAIGAFDGILILLGLAAPPVTFFGSVLLLGARHGPSIFWDVYMTPAGFGFVLPSAGALIVAFSRGRAPALLGVIIALITLLIETFASLQSPEGFTYIKRAIEVMPILTWSVALLGPVTCAISIAAGLAKINYSRRVSEQA